MFTLHQVISDQFTSQGGSIFIERRQNFVDLFFGITITRVKRLGNEAQDRFQLLVLGRQGLETAVRQAVIMDDLAVVRACVHPGSQVGQQVSCQQAT